MSLIALARSARRSDRFRKYAEDQPSQKGRPEKCQANSQRNNREVAEIDQAASPARRKGFTHDSPPELTASRLIKGEADAAALGFHVGISIASRLYREQVTLPQNMFTELPFAVAVAKGQRAQFLTQFNAGIAAIRADGTWQRINNQWTGK